MQILQVGSFTVQSSDSKRYNSIRWSNINRSTLAILKASATFDWWTKVFHKASFLKAKSAANIWSPFLLCWVSIYVVFPAKIRSDKESAVTLEQFRQNASIHAIDIEVSGISSHNSMGEIESAHGPLSRIYRMLTDSYPNFFENLWLRFSVKAPSDTAVVNDLVSSLKVFGDPTSMGNTEVDLPGQEKLFNVVHTNRKEADTTILKQHTKLELRANTPPLAKYSLKVGGKS